MLILTRTSNGRNLISIHPRQCDCQVCLAEWGEWMEQKREIDNLALAEIELRQAKPATDAEWQSFLDGEWPRVREGGGS